MGRYVQTFMFLLSLILLKEEYAQKMAFLHASLGLAMPFYKGVN
jgi:hypothetical protein